MDVLHHTRLVRGEEVFQDPDVFADITSVPYLGLTAEGDSLVAPYIFHFDGDLTDEEVALVKQRAATSPVEEVIRRNARDVYRDLRTIRDSSGSLTNAQLSQAVRVLAKAEIALARLALEDLEASD